MLPLVDVAPLLDRSDVAGVARQLDQACRRFGFVRITGHGVPDGLREQLTALASEFFALPDETKAGIEMSRAGPAWRGWFPVGGELTSGVPDGKEGVYFGEELPADDPRVVAGVPLHGRNLFPARPAALGPVVLAWMDAMTSLGQVLLRALAIGLGLDEHWFDDHVTGPPTTLFRIFHYPPGWATGDDWGVREHTDYGLLTILAQDGTATRPLAGAGGGTAPTSTRGRARTASTSRPRCRVCSRRCSSAPCPTRRADVSRRMRAPTSAGVRRRRGGRHRRR